MTHKQIHVAVLMGGLSSEREVSLRSGAACDTILVRATSANARGGFSSVAIT